MTQTNKPSKPKKQRVDQLLVDRGLVESRTKAQALIMAGKVFTGEQRVQKPGDKLADDKPLEVRGQDHPWVSRGGLKLEKGLKEFDLDPTGITAIDVGASTGGFTDVLLQNGAAKVYAVDVGRGQLHWNLRQDDRVVVLEETNARHLTTEIIPDPIDAVVCDASFIGLEKVLPAAMSLTRPGAWLVALIKPQFQVGKGQVGKGGVVRDPELHAAVCEEVKNWIDTQEGWHTVGITESPITGPQGNVEFLIYAGRTDAE
ncbi:TlyA family RNA methyltransferase [Aestuariispira ectoiniformans]|uniref:TlyA family RNA methyltransferase n=1 Tax=Aestuariispira ectoiniformans TaxID=2775080 RepID=UPI00223B9558|nr:TlyA family RNA methyltransferase [Aestuariispira ectoiniformans]